MGIMEGARFVIVTQSISRRLAGAWFGRGGESEEVMGPSSLQIRDMAMEMLGDVGGGCETMSKGLH